MRNVLRNGASLQLKQFVYQPGKSTTDALYYIIREVEKTIEAKKFVSGIFIDIEGAFDNTSFKSMKSAAEKLGIEPAVTCWIELMLKNRIITASLGEKLKN